MRGLRGYDVAVRLAMILAPALMTVLITGLVTALVTALVTGPPAHAGSPGPQFIDVTEAAGLDFDGVYGTTFSDLANADQAMMQRNMGTGVAVGDYDGDGDLDVYLVGQMGESNKLLRNELDQGSKTFTDVTAAAGVDDLGFSRLAAFVDLNNDGRLDLVVLNDQNLLGSYPGSKLFFNQGDGTFLDVTNGSGFDPRGYLHCGLGIADYDGDGLLDLYVTNWSMELGLGAAQFPGSNRLYRNIGNFNFQDVTGLVGLGQLNRDSFTPIFHDFDGDGDPDLYVAVDHSSDVYYRNMNGFFVDTTIQVGATHTGNDMGVAAADFDGDDDLDLYMTNITDSTGYFGTTQHNVLYVDAGLPGTVQLVDEAVSRGAQDTYWGWGVEWVDLENDGDLDIVAATGFDQFVGALYGPTSPIYQTPTVALINDGSGNFQRNDSVGLFFTDDSRALVAFDYDRDGDEDLLWTNTDQPARLLENVSEEAGHALTVRLVQSPGANRDGVGARVYASHPGGERRADIIGGGSYLAGVPFEAHLGLGEQNTVPQLRVAWTDGTETTYQNVAADRVITIEQGGSDGDLDGIEDASDCAPTQGDVWSAPQVDIDLEWAGPSTAVLQWSASGESGSFATRFDLLRSSDASMQSNVTCLREDTIDTAALDPTLPGEIFFYLVRVENGCGVSAGTGESDLPRSLPDC